MKTIKETCYKGTRIVVGNEKRKIINKMVSYLTRRDFTEIIIPTIQMSDTFDGKVGDENNNMMYNFSDRGGRNLCLAPEYTSIIQKLAETTYKYEKDVELFYIQECFRGEKPQAGRFRQFTQFGVEVINPSKDYLIEYIGFARDLINIAGLSNIDINVDVKRGLDYYTEGKGFEIVCEEMGGSKQICGGGEYKGGFGFAIGLDRILSYEG